MIPIWREHLSLMTLQNDADLYLLTQSPGWLTVLLVEFVSVVLPSSRLSSNFDHLNFKFCSHQPLLGVTKVFLKLNQGEPR